MNTVTVKLTDKDLQVISQALSQMPLGQAMETFTSLQRQVNEAQKPKDE